MSWITVIWSASAGVCLALASVHLIVWLRERVLWVYFWFSLSAAAAAATAIFELILMHAETAAATGVWLCWIVTSVTVIIIALIWFVRAYLGGGSLWMAWLTCGLRVLVTVINFLPGRANVVFREMNAPNRLEAWGETVSAPAGIGTEWTTLVTVSSVFFLVYLLGAIYGAWRRGIRRRAVLLGVALCLGFLVGMTLTRLAAAGNLSVPFTISLLFLPVVLVIGYELSGDLVRGKQTEKDLLTSQERLRLAAEAAELGVWDWDVVRDAIHVSAPVRERLGLTETQPLDFDRYLQSVCPEDRHSLRKALRAALEGAGDFEAEYRVVTKDGVTRWIAARGRVQPDSSGKPTRLRGVSMDITPRKDAEIEVQQLRYDLAHVSRTTTLNELSVSLAHELNQPLGIILSNAQAAQDLIAGNPQVPGEVGEILSDIVAADRRAAAVIQQMRAMLKRGEPLLTLLSLNDVVEEVLTLIRADFITRGITAVSELAHSLPRALGDRVQIQQVVMNLLLNASDAMMDKAPGTRRLTVATTHEGDKVRVSVRDQGPGLPPDLEQIFGPFFTTKKSGLGLGLTICRSIIDAHQGRFWAENNPEGGAVFYFELAAADTPTVL